MRVLRTALILGSVMALLGAAPAQAAEPGGIAGTVSLGSDQGALITVEAFTPGGDYVTGVRTDGSGAYLIDGLEPGPYLVHFADSSEFVYAEEWWDDQPTMATALQVGVLEGAVTSGIDALLDLPGDEGGWISGTITDAATGAPACATVVVVAIDGTELGQARPDAAGAYRVGRLGSADVRVQFVDNCEFVHADQWYDGQPSAGAAAVLTVTAEQELTGIDAALSRPIDTGGAITGRVTEATTGQPVAGICPAVYDETGTMLQVQGPFYVRSQDDGAYRVGGLAPGTYRVEFVDCGPFLYETRWWDGKADLAGADPVAVQAGQETPGVNVALTRAPGAPPPSPPPAATDGTLPFTGSPLLPPALLGLLALLAGTALVRATRPAVTPTNQRAP